MSKEFREIINLILNGEDIASEAINRPLRQIGGNLRYLFEMFELAAEGSTVFARAQLIDPSAKLSQPVYYDASKGRWGRARAAAFLDPYGVLTVAETGQVWGIIYKKFTNNRADILLIGSVEMDISPAIDGTIVSGQYYLSTKEPGKLVFHPPSVAIPVLKVGPEGAKAGTHRITVDPNFHDLIGTHEHLKYNLVMEPAGIANIIGGVWVITGPDTDIEGWLPANHAIFSGNAPAGALFGYNLSVSPLGEVWPPTPLSSTYGVWNTGQTISQLGTGIDADDAEIMKATVHGVWWMSNCIGEVPWEASVTTTSTTTSTTAEPVTTTTTTTFPPEEMSLVWWGENPNYFFRTADNNITDITTYEYLDNTTRAADLALDVSGQRLFWINGSTQNRVYRGDRDGDNQAILKTSTPGGFGNGEAFTNIEYDAHERKIYVLAEDGTVWRTNPDGTNDEELFTIVPFAVSSFAVHSAMDWLFVCNNGDIEVYLISTGALVDTISPSLDATHIAVDIQHSLLFYLNRTADTIYLRRAWLDGTNEAILVTRTDSSNTSAAYLAPDVDLGRVYYGIFVLNPGLFGTTDNEIWRVAYGGTGNTRLYTTPAHTVGPIRHWSKPIIEPTSTTSTTSTTTSTTTTTTVDPGFYMSKELWVHEGNSDNNLYSVDFSGDPMTLYPRTSPTETGGQGLCLVSALQRVYWIEGSNTIYRGHVSGILQVEVVNNSDPILEGRLLTCITYDPVDELIYIGTAGKIFSMELDGSNLTVVATFAYLGTPPAGIAVHSAADRIYLTGYSLISGSTGGSFEGLRIFQLNGTELSPITDVMPGQDISVHRADNKIFYCFQGTTRVVRANLDGTNHNEIFNVLELGFNDIVTAIVADQNIDRVFIVTRSVTTPTIGRLWVNNDYDELDNTLLRTDTQLSIGLSLDIYEEPAVGDDLWWFHNYSNSIHRSEFAGTSLGEYTRGAGVESMSALAVDAVHGKVYWATTETVASIYWGELNQTDQDLVGDATDFGVPSTYRVVAIEYEPYQNKLYTLWKDGSTGANQRLVVSNRDGSSPSTLINITDTGFRPLALAMSYPHGVIYICQDDITGPTSDRIKRFNWAGVLQQTYATAFNDGIAIDRVTGDVFIINKTDGAAVRLTDTTFSGTSDIYSNANYRNLAVAVDPITQFVYLHADDTGGDVEYYVYRIEYDGSNPTVLLNDTTDASPADCNFAMAVNSVEVIAGTTTTTTTSTSTTTTSTTTTSTTTTSTTSTTAEPDNEMWWVAPANESGVLRYARRSDLDATNIKWFWVPTTPGTSHIAVDPTRGEIYRVNNNSRIYRNDYDGSNLTLIRDFGSLPNVNDLDYDPYLDRIGITMGSAYQILNRSGTTLISGDFGIGYLVRGIAIHSRLNLFYLAIDGPTDQIQIRNLTTGVLIDSADHDELTDYVCVDRDTNEVFFGSDNGNGPIYQANSDLSSPVEIFTDVAYSPDSLAVDPLQKKLYVLTESGPSVYSILRMDYDGNNVEVLVNDAPVAFYINTIDIDRVASQATSTTTTPPP